MQNDSTPYKLSPSSWQNVAHSTIGGIIGGTFALALGAALSWLLIGHINTTAISSLLRGIGDSVGSGTSLRLAPSITSATTHAFSGSYLILRVLSVAIPIGFGAIGVWCGRRLMSHHSTDDPSKSTVIKTAGPIRQQATEVKRLPSTIEQAIHREDHLSEALHESPVTPFTVRTIRTQPKHPYRSTWARG